MNRIQAKFVGEAIVNRLDQAYQKVADVCVQRPILFSFLLSLLFLWPTLLNSGPYYFGDTEGYLRGGELAIAFAGNLVSGLFGGGAADDGRIAAATSGIHGVRSVAYAVFTYLGRWPDDTMFLSVWVQSALVIFVLDTFFEQVGIRQKAPRALLGIWAILIFVTPMPWFAVYATPDVFAGIAILAIGLLTVYQDKIHLYRRLVLSGLAYFSVLAHLSMIPILGLLGALSGLVFLLDLRRVGWLNSAKGYAWVAVPLLLGLASSLAINIVGFDEPSVVGKRYPILLARSIEDGPSHRYLTESCEQGMDYAVCEIYPDNNIPTTAGEFLWEKGGIRDLATSEQMERVRQEESEIIQAAMSRYPLDTVLKSVSHGFQQIFSIALIDHKFEQDIERNHEGEVYTTYAKPERLGLKAFFEVVFLTAFAGILFLLIWLIRSGALSYHSPFGRLMVMVGGGILINAAICGALSAVTDRYQGRVVWAFMACVLIIAWDYRRAQQKTMTAPASDPEISAL